jgi:CBS domain-containing protein
VFWALQQVIADKAGLVMALADYLSYINLALALFNLVPGFPLDGGRVLRAIIWRVTNSMERAPVIASGIGQGVAVLMIGGGIVLILSGDLGGLWIIFIGWFLNNAAEASRRDMVTRKLFQGIQVRDLMDPNPETAPPDMTVDAFVRRHILGRGQRALPVSDDGRLVGIVSVADVRELPEDRWATTPISEIMMRSPLYQVSPNAGIGEALAIIAERGVHQLLVTDGDRLVGLVTRAHILEHLEFREELGVPGRNATGASA